MNQQPGLLASMLNKLQTFQPEPSHSLGAIREAAVLLALTREAVPQVVLTRRADHLNSHSGEVALPGGMWEPGDGDLMHTALRESWEEVAMPPEAVDIRAQLPYRVTRNGVGVTPFVGVIAPDQTFVANPEELDSIFHVPVTFFLDPRNCVSFPWALDGQEFWLPCYDFERYRIWGMTLNVLVDLLNIAMDANIQLAYPEQFYELQVAAPA